MGTTKKLKIEKPTKTYHSLKNYLYDLKMDYLQQLLESKDLQEQEVLTEGKHVVEDIIAFCEKRGRF